jgi:hypothetical protein
MRQLLDSSGGWKCDEFSLRSHGFRVVRAPNMKLRVDEEAGADLFVEQDVI